jgi:hypothetical protein
LFSDYKMIVEGIGAMSLSANPIIVRPLTVHS